MAEMPWETKRWYRGVHNCKPPCALMRLDEHAAARPRMKKAELIAEAAAYDEQYINAQEELDMRKGYERDLLNHLHAHGCTHEYEQYDSFNGRERRIAGRKR